MIFFPEGSTPEKQLIPYLQLQFHLFILRYYLFLVLLRLLF